MKIGNSLEAKVISEQLTQLPRPRRAAVAGFLGTAIEYYEFGVYGYLAVVISPLFFPSGNAATSLLSALAVWGTSFLIRPLGGVVLGRLGDRHGRRRILMITVLGMGCATALTGALPTYASVGLGAPILLLICRLAQGFFAGGELSGAAAFATESAPTGRRSFYGGFVPMGAAVGGGFAALICAGTWVIFDAQAMSAWAWRLPFLMALPLIIVSLIIRSKIEETPVFLQSRNSDELEKSPVSQLMRNHKKTVLQVIGLSYPQAAGYWVGIVFMYLYLVQTVGYDKQSALWMIAGVSILAGLCTPFAGILSDKIGRKLSFVVGYLGYGLLIVPAMLLMDTGNDVAVMVAMILLVMPFPFVQAAGCTAYAEMFPTSVRYTGTALATNIGTILGGGLSPFLATWINSVTGSGLAAGFLLIAAALIGLGTALTLKETAYSDLR
ncbi:Proline/betaine transporter [Rhodococcus erythropolis]|nr:Proline/betaine transporter [Rhodococcus erythropolis]